MDKRFVAALVKRDMVERFVFVVHADGVRIAVVEAGQPGVYVTAARGGVRVFAGLDSALKFAALCGLKREDWTAVIRVEAGA